MSDIPEYVQSEFQNLPLGSSVQNVESTLLLGVVAACLPCFKGRRQRQVAVSKASYICFTMGEVYLNFVSIYYECTRVCQGRVLEFTTLQSSCCLPACLPCFKGRRQRQVAMSKASHICFTMGEVYLDLVSIYQEYTRVCRGQVPEFSSVQNVNRTLEQLLLACFAQGQKISASCCE